MDNHDNVDLILFKFDMAVDILSVGLKNPRDSWINDNFSIWLGNSLDDIFDLNFTTLGFDQVADNVWFDSRNDTFNFDTLGEGYQYMVVAPPMGHVNDDFRISRITASIPPASILLLLIGLFSFAALNRRKKGKTQFTS